ncbi:MAG: aspartate aminotransferase family protein [Thermoplasmatota archaeon]
MTLLHFFPLKNLEVTHARNAHLHLSDGRAVLDVGGASHGAAIVGHSHPDVVAAVQSQAAQVMHVAHLYPNPARTQFLDRLHARLPAAFDKTFLCNSGAEAVEAAVKFAAAATGRSRFLAAENGFHGRTLGALSVTHKPAYREPVAGLVADCDFVPYNDVEALKNTISGEHAAVVLEPIQGEGGVVPATTEYLATARDLCDDVGALLILDEVQTGLCRTGPFLAAAHHGIEADITTLGKGLAGGVPVGACVTRSDIQERLPPAFHGSTYGASPIQCAAGAATLQVLETENLAQRSSDEGTRFMSALSALEHPAIQEVRGVGMMANVDLKIRPGPVLQELEQQGFLALAGGPRGIRFLPPLTTESVDLDATVDALQSALG